jgi:hypothetical protein
MYSQQPRLRVTPPGGPATVYDLSLIETMQSAQVIPYPIFSAKETVGYRRRNIRKAWRLHAAFVWIVDAGSAGEATLVEIMFAVNRRGYKLELDMDGTLYREVELEAWPPRQKWPEGKNVGALYQAEFACVEPLSEASLPPETRQAPPGIAGWS